MVAIDTLLQGDVESALKLIHMRNGFDADLENQAFRHSKLSSDRQLVVRKSTKLTNDLVDAYKRSKDGIQWRAGYVDGVLDTLEKRAGMREV